MAKPAGPAESLPAANPCCEKVKKRLEKLAVGRDALRQTISILETELKNAVAMRDALTEENRRLKIVCEEHQHCSKAVAEAKVDSVVRKSLEKQVTELQAELSSLRKVGTMKKEGEEEMLIFELKSEIERLRNLLDNEKKRCDSEKRKAEEQGSKAKEAWNLLKSERSKNVEERKLAAMDKKATSEVRASYEKIQCEVTEVRKLLNLETNKVVESNKLLEAEKKNTSKQKKRAEAEKSVAAELKSLLESEKKKVIEEKKRADLLFQKFQEEKRRGDELDNRLSIVSSDARSGNHQCLLDKSNEISTIKLLREELKLKKKQLKLAKDTIKLEKAKGALAIKELSLLKQEMVRLVNRFDMLDNHLSDGIGSGYFGEKYCSEMLGSTVEHGLDPGKSAVISFDGEQTKSLLNFGSSYPNECLPNDLSRHCRRLTSGIHSVLGCSVGGFPKIKSQSSARRPYPPPISDEKLVGSQEKDNTFTSQSTKNGNCVSMKKSMPNICPVENKESAEAKSSRKNRYSSTSTDGMEKLTCRRKRRKIGETSNPSSTLNFVPTLSTSDRLEAHKKDTHLNGNEYIEVGEISSEHNGTTPNMPLHKADVLCSVEEDTVALDRRVPTQRFDQVSVPPSTAIEDFNPFLCMEPVNGAIMKLFDFDNVADEERFKRAVENPISPLRADIIKFVSSCNINITNSHLDNGYRKGQNSASTKSQDKTISVRQPSDVGCILPVNSGVSVGKHEETTNYIFGFVNMDSNNIERLLTFWVEVINPLLNATSSPLDVFGAALDRVLHEAELLTRDKACIIFSLMMQLVCPVLSKISGNIKKDDCASLSCLLCADIQFEWHTLESKYIFALVSVIEAFLLNDTPLSTETSFGNSFSSKQKICNSNVPVVHFSSAAATVNQFMAGCIILASVCLKLNRVDLVMSASYKQLCRGAEVSPLCLVALHTYEAVCGDRFLKHSCDDFLVTALKLVVLKLESKNSAQSSGIQLAGWPTVFPPCDDCPFSSDVSMDSFIPLILKEMEQCFQYDDCCTNAEDPNSIPATASSVSYEKGCDTQSEDSCSVVMYQKNRSGKVENLTGAGLCYFMELISLVELIGIYMCWEWIHERVVVRLLEMLKSCKYEFSAALFALVGHLGRAGVDESGYDNKEVCELKAQLAAIVETTCVLNERLPVQFAAVGALLNLLPFTYKQITEDTGSSTDPCKLVILKWYRRLSKKEQSLSFTIFG